MKYNKYNNNDVMRAQKLGLFGKSVVVVDPRKYEWAGSYVFNSKSF